MKVAALALGVLVLASTQVSAMEPFGAEAVPSKSVDLIAVWQVLRRELAEDAAKIERCRTRQTCNSPEARRFISIVDEARRYGGRQMIGHLNRSINSAIPATHANVPWRAPLAALGRAGDCKSYAVAKYLALADAGIAPGDRRLAMLRIAMVPGELHLVTLVREGEHWLILDNRTLTLVESTTARQYLPLHELDESGVRDFK